MKPLTVQFATPIGDDGKPCHIGSYGFGWRRWWWWSDGGWYSLHTQTRSTMPLSPFQDALYRAHPVPLSKECMESFWDGTRSGTAEQCLKAACVSHEVMRGRCEEHHVTRHGASAELDDIADKAERGVGPDELRRLVDRIRSVARILARSELV